MRALICLFLIAIVAAPASFAQKASFEVASVKPNQSEQGGGTIGPRGNEFFATNITLRNLLNFAYRPQVGRLLDAQIIGGPDWSKRDRFDIEAKAGVDMRSVSAAQLQLMVQSLLEERFQLKVHREMRELPTYELVVTKSGVKMKVSEDQTPPDPRQAFVNFDVSGLETAPLPRGAMRLSGNPYSTTLLANAVPISRLIDRLLQSQADRIIFDKTELKGLFDIRLQFSRESGPAGPDVTAPLSTDPAFPSLFTAIQELGLKLEPSKASLEVVMIDSVQKPKPN